MENKLIFSVVFVFLFVVKFEQGFCLLCPKCYFATYFPVCAKPIPVNWTSCISNSIMKTCRNDQVCMKYRKVTQFKKGYQQVEYAIFCIEKDGCNKQECPQPSYMHNTEEEISDISGISCFDFKCAADNVTPDQLISHQPITVSQLKSSEEIGMLLVYVVCIVVSCMCCCLFSILLYVYFNLTESENCARGHCCSA
ncbi:uncharacterized protein LOC110240021 [Exaiptasia diaphana]|uniref:UPAR/Ly6 domain-containing protein n=1 Tax=Exaiptasia diaphana TaxID=2652724 RepID=A0A913YJF8_EXADI|nr:uncharacterized protein LOC110240021 [Exaiptasia diaphana]